MQKLERKAVEMIGLFEIERVPGFGENQEAAGRNGFFMNTPG